MTWYWIVAAAIGGAAALLLLSAMFYMHFFKRFYDIVLSSFFLISFSPLLIILTAVGAIVMKGNPFFVQERHGRKDKRTGREKIFKLIKFRTMTNEKDGEGNLLPDEERLTSYGRFLRKTSLDELCQLINILKRDMAFVGPRPLLVKYLNRYSEEQRRRHDVRPGLTGLAQANGRNAISWEEKFKKDVFYVKRVSLLTDIKIVFGTISVLFRRSGIGGAASEIVEEFTGNIAKPEKELS